MSNLKDILGEDEYNNMGEELENRLKNINQRKKELDVKEKKKLNDKEFRRKVIMGFLISIYEDPLCQRYIELNGSLELGNSMFERIPKIGFKSNGIYLKVYSQNFPFPYEGKGTIKVSCGMGGSYTKNYKIEDYVRNISKFKQIVTKSVAKKIRK